MNNLDFAQNGGGGAMGPAAGQPQNQGNQIQQIVLRNLHAQIAQNPPQGWQTQLAIGNRYHQILQMATSIKTILEGESWPPATATTQAFQRAIAIEREVYQRASSLELYQSTLDARNTTFKEKRQQIANTMQFGNGQAPQVAQRVPASLQQSIPGPFAQGQNMMHQGIQPRAINNDPAVNPGPQHLPQPTPGMLGNSVNPSPNAAMQRPVTQQPQLPQQSSARNTSQNQTMAQRLADFRSNIANQLFAGDISRMGGQEQAEAAAARSFSAEKLHMCRESNTNPVHLYYREKAHEVMRQKNLISSGRTAPTRQPPQPGQPSVPVPNGIQNQSNQNVPVSFQGQSQIDPKQFLGQQADAQRSQAAAQRSQAAGDLVVPASNNPSVNGQVPNYSGIPALANNAVGRPGAQGSALPQQPVPFAQPGQRPGIQGAQAAQAQAQAHALLNVQQPHPMPHTPNSASLQGQTGGLHGSQNQQPSPGMPTLNSSFGPPVDQASRAPQRGNQAGAQGSHQPSPQSGATMQRQVTQNKGQHMSQPGGLTSAGVSGGDVKSMAAMPHQMREFFKNATTEEKQRFVAQMNARQQHARRPQPSIAQSAPSSAPQTRPPPPPPPPPPPQTNPNAQRPPSTVAQPLQQRVGPGQMGSQPQPGQQPATAHNGPTPAQRQQIVQNQGLLKLGERIRLPVDIINQNIPSFRHPPQMQTWYDLRQWVSQNSHMISAQDQKKLEDLFVTHVMFQIKQQRLSNEANEQGSMPQPQNGVPRGPPSQPTPQQAQQVNSQQLQTANPRSLQAHPLVRQGLVFINASGAPQMRAIHPNDIQGFRQKLPPQAYLQTDNDIARFLEADTFNKIVAGDRQLAMQINPQRAMHHQVKPTQPLMRPQPNPVGPRNQMPTPQDVVNQGGLQPHAAAPSGMQNFQATGLGVNGIPTQMANGFNNVNTVGMPQNIATMQPPPSQIPNQMQRQNQQPPTPHQRMPVKPPQVQQNLPAQAHNAIRHHRVMEFERMKKQAEGMIHQLISAPTQEYPPQILKSVIDRLENTKRELKGVFWAVQNSFLENGKPQGHSVLLRDIMVISSQMRGPNGTIRLTVPAGELQEAFGRLKQFTSTAAGKKASAQLQNSVARLQLQKQPSGQASQQQQQPIPGNPPAQAKNNNSKPPQQPSAQAASMERRPSSKKTGPTKVPPAPPTATRPTGAPPLKPDGTPIYGDNSNHFSPERMTIPPTRKKRKVAQPTKDTPATSTTEAQPTPPAMAASPQLTAMQPKSSQPSLQQAQQPEEPPPQVDLAYKCPIPGCGLEKSGLETEDKRDEHVRSDHRADGRPVEYCASMIKKCLVVQKPAQDTVAKPGPQPHVQKTASGLVKTAVTHPLSFNKERNAKSQAAAASQTPKTKQQTPATPQPSSSLPGATKHQVPSKTSTKRTADQAFSDETASTQDLNQKSLGTTVAPADLSKNVVGSTKPNAITSCNKDADPDAEVETGPWASSITRHAELVREFKRPLIDQQNHNAFAALKVPGEDDLPDLTASPQDSPPSDGSPSPDPEPNLLHWNPFAGELNEMPDFMSFMDADDDTSIFAKMANEIDGRVNSAIVHGKPDALRNLKDPLCDPLFAPVDSRDVRSTREMVQRGFGPIAVGAGGGGGDASPIPPLSPPGYLVPFPGDEDFQFAVADEFAMDEGAVVENPEVDADLRKEGMETAGLSTDLSEVRDGGDVKGNDLKRKRDEGDDGEGNGLKRKRDDDDDGEGNGDERPSKRVSTGTGTSAGAESEVVVVDL